MKANERQVGGDHYRAEYQHWDFCVDHAVPHLEGSATKYALRFRKKNGAQDLEKALHYVQKMRDVHAEGRYQNTINQCEIADNVGRMIVGAGLQPGSDEDLAILMLVTWRNDADLAGVQEFIRKLIDREYVSRVRTQEA